MLLDDVVAGEPGVSRASCAAATPCRSSSPGAAWSRARPGSSRRGWRRRRRWRRRAARFIASTIRRMMAALRAGGDRRGPSACAIPPRSKTDLIARGIHGHRLLGEHVLAGLDRGLQVHRPERRRRGEDHVVDVAGDDLLEGVPAGELPLVWGRPPCRRASSGSPGCRPGDPGRDRRSRRGGRLARH